MKGRIKKKKGKNTRERKMKNEKRKRGKNMKWRNVDMEKYEDGEEREECEKGIERKKKWITGRVVISINNHSMILDFPVMTLGVGGGGWALTDPPTLIHRMPACVEQRGARGSSGQLQEGWGVLRCWLLAVLFVVSVKMCGIPALTPRHVPPWLPLLPCADPSAH